MIPNISIKSLLSVTFLVALLLAIWQYNVYLNTQARLARNQAIELVYQIPDTTGNGPNDSVCDPTAIPRAVHSLRNLGKNEALLALEEFVVRYPERAHYATVSVILPYLFEPDEKTPTPYLFELENGFVFHTYPFGWNGSLPTHRTEHIQWAKTSSKLRESELIPSGNPCVAADNLLAKIRNDPEVKENEFPYYQRHIFRQVHFCTQHLLKPNSKFKTYAPGTSADWRIFKSELARLTPKWDPVGQTFIGRE